MATIYTDKLGRIVIRLGTGNGEITCHASVTFAFARRLACEKYPLGTPDRRAKIIAELRSSVLVRADEDNNAEEFWGELDAAFHDVAEQLRESGVARVTAADWEAIRKLPGFSDGPDYAPDALIAGA